MKKVFGQNYLYTSEKTNILSKKLIKDVHLAIKYRLKLDMVLYTSYSLFFFGFYKNVEVVIKKLKIRYKNYMIIVCEYYLIKSTFLNIMKFYQKYK